MKKLILSFGLLAMLTSCTSESSTAKKATQSVEVQSFDFTTSKDKYVDKDGNSNVTVQSNHWIYNNSTHVLTNEESGQTPYVFDSITDIGNQKLRFYYTDTDKVSTFIFDCSEVDKKKMTVTVSEENKDTSTNIFFN